jgi:hypothetical protein
MDSIHTNISLLIFAVFFLFSNLNITGIMVLLILPHTLLGLNGIIFLHIFFTCMFFSLWNQEFSRTLNLRKTFQVPVFRQAPLSLNN